MRITVVGSGYVGLVTAGCLADTGSEVVAVDRDVEKIRRLNAGEVPIYEPGLDSVIARTMRRGKLSFTTDLASAVAGSSAVFIAVGTPPNDDGSADLSQVRAVADAIGSVITDYTVVITKSTVPVGTAEIVRSSVKTALDRRGADIEFDVASNPEFLKEGDAIADFMRPDRIVIGTDGERAERVLEQVYRPFLLNGHPLIFMDIASAEITKYAANAMLATRISFMNTISQLCESVGADVSSVRKGIGSDRRIGPAFLYAGVGYGGSCFPKDVRALSESARAHGVRTDLIDAVESINERQKYVAVNKLNQALGVEADSDLSGRKFAVWGLAFKPNTDDVREAPAAVVIKDLLQRGAAVCIYDPVATGHMEHLFEGIDTTHLSVGETPEATVTGAAALILMTEWNEFRSVDPWKLASLMSGRIVIDGRNALDAADFAAAGFFIDRIGRPAMGR